MDTLAPFGAAVLTILAVWGITHRQIEALATRMDKSFDQLRAEKADKQDIKGLADKQDVRDLSGRIDTLMLELLRWQRPPA
jgi:hypothetical protein